MKVEDMIFLAGRPTLYRLWGSMKACIIKSWILGTIQKYASALLKVELCAGVVSY